MAEKRVSVRLIATGGDGVKAVLHGVGEAGQRGMARFSSAVDVANARFAAFAAKARLAAFAAGAAVAVAGAAMIRSSLQTIDAQGKLAQSLLTTTASVQVLERAGELAGVSMSGVEQAAKDMTRRLSQAAAGTGPAVKALDALHLKASDLMAVPLDARIAMVSDAMTRFVPAAQRAAVAGAIFGEEGSIAMSRIDSETIRQATADLTAFGVIVDETGKNQIARTNDALSRLGLIARGVSNQLAVAAAPAMEAVANAMAAIFSVSGPVGQGIKIVFDNLGRLVTYAGTFVALMAGRWVAGMAAAALSVNGVATALVFLRGALIRTGIGALIVLAGELVYQFTRLVKGSGGFGEALTLLKAVAVEVMERIRFATMAVAKTFYAVTLSIEAWWGTMFYKLTEKAHEWARGSVSILAHVADWLDPNKTYADFMAEIPAVEDVLAKPSEEAAKRAVNAWGQVTDLWSQTTKPLESWQALSDAMANADEGVPAITRTTDATNDLGDALATAGAKGKKAKDEIATGWGAVSKGLADYAKDAMNWGKGLGDTLVGAFRGAEDAFRNFTKTGKFDFKGMIASILSDLATLAFRSAVLGPLANALAGAFGGGGGGLGGVLASIFHTGTNAAGYSQGPAREVPAAAFLNAPRFHKGLSWLKSDEFPAILQRGERVIPRGGDGGGGGMAFAPVFNIDARGAQQGVAEQIDARMRAYTPEMKRMAEQAIAEARIRGRL